MSGTATLLAESAERLFAAHCDKALRQAAEAGVWPKPLWDAVEEAGFCAALLPEDAGGFGVTVAEALSLVRIAAEHAAPVPLAETMLPRGCWPGRAAGAAGCAQPGAGAPHGCSGAAPGGEGWRLTGRAARIPWGRNCAALVVLAEGPDGPAGRLRHPGRLHR